MSKIASSAPQTIIPYLTYQDADEAIRFLCDAFGFEERSRMAMPDGRVGHAEISLDDQSIYLASAFAELGLAGPLDLEAVHTQIFVYVDDVEAHHDRAREAGATIARPPEDQPHGDRMYRAIDPGGHRWMFSSRGPVEAA